MTDSAKSTIGPRTRTAFWFCGFSLGIVSASLSFSLLIFYNQVMGLNAALAGLALAIALGVDAITDPMVGWWSDRVHSKHGRRHPFLYAALLPTFVGYVFVWFPPFDAGSQWALFAYLLGTSILMRLGMTLFDVPSNALIAELTSDYEERTRLSSFKVSASWMAANITGILAYAIWLNDRGGPPGSGLLRAEGYQSAGLVFASTMAVLMVVMIVLLRPTVPYLAGVSEQLDHGKASFKRAMAELFETYANRSILAILGTAIFLAAAVGLTSALWVYFMQFYFGLASHQLNQVQYAYLAAAVLAIILLPRLCKGRDKRRLALQIGTVFWIIDVAPYALRTLDWFPVNGDPALMPVLLVYSLIDGLLINMLMALVMSMLTDVVEDNLLRTGRREEGVVLAGQTLVSKCSTALGTASGGVLLTVVGFPQIDAAAQVPADILWNLGAVYWAAMWALGLCSVLALRTYTIRRTDHAAAVATLEKQAAQ